MLKRNWIIVVALGLTLAGPALPQELEPPRPKGQIEFQGEIITDVQRPQNNDQAEDSGPENLTLILNKIESAIRDLVAQERAAQSQGRDQHDVRDLDAQEQMALWAQAMFWANAVAVVLTFAGLVLIGFTLHHTKRASNYAEEMAVEARKATKAANDTFLEAQAANAIAKDGLIAQHRPWLVLEVDDSSQDGVAMVRFDGEGSAEVTLMMRARNIGKSPARMVLYDMKAYWTYSEWPSFDELAAFIDRTKQLKGSHAKYASTIIPEDLTKFGFVRMNAKPVEPRPETWSPKHGVAIVVTCCVVYKSEWSDDWFHTANIVAIRQRLPEGRHPRDRPRFGWNQGTFQPDRLEAHVSKSGGTSSIE